MIKSKINMSDSELNGENNSAMLADSSSAEGPSKKNTSGIAQIKSCYLVKEVEKTLNLEYLPEETREKLLSEPDPKRPKLSKQDMKALTRGQNKNRGHFKFSQSNVLCTVLRNWKEGEEMPKCGFPNCPYSHDLSSFMQNREPDIGSYCFSYETNGKCRFGPVCRFGSRHTTEKGHNKINGELWSEDKNKSNWKSGWTNDLQRRLRKHMYDFSKSSSAVKKFEALNKSESDTKAVVGPVTDEAEIKLTSREKTKIDWTGKLYLAPLTTVGNLPFRRVCKKLGADITCSEMTMSMQVLKGVRNEWVLLRRHESEDLFGAQICGYNPEVMTRCAELLDKDGCVDFVDVNMGCPLDAIFKTGAGSGLLRRKNIVERIISGMSDVLNIPLTVKMRAGCFQGKHIAHQLIPIYKKYNVDLVTLHGRARDQRYTKMADWHYVKQCCEQLRPLPLFGNGDVLSYEDYYCNMKQSGVNGIMLGRGALIKPWIFKEIKEQRHWDISAQERLDLLKDYVNFGLEYWGSDSNGVETTRRFLLEWLSFLHRYIPVDLLECLPQKINERPPPYKGRNELETILSSPSCRDWIKISEMLLGPVPNHFSFIPKHKASAWS